MSSYYWIYLPPGPKCLSLMNVRSCYCSWNHRQPGEQCAKLQWSAVDKDETNEKIIKADLLNHRSGQSLFCHVRNCKHLFRIDAIIVLRALAIIFRRMQSFFAACQRLLAVHPVFLCVHCQLKSISTPSYVDRVLSLGELGAIVWLLPPWDSRRRERFEDLYKQDD